MEVVTGQLKPGFACARQWYVFILLAPHLGKIKHFILELVLVGGWGLPVPKRNKTFTNKSQCDEFWQYRKGYKVNASDSGIAIIIFHFPFFFLSQHMRSVRD